MKIIISPAKKMNTDTDSFSFIDYPKFLNRTEELLNILKTMSYEQLKNLWKCNDNIANLNYERLNKMDLRKNLTPAIIAYEGIQYQYMAPSVFTEKQLEYVQQSLRIISGFYGVLKPFDGVTPYRLEMQAKLKTDNFSNLYKFWKDDIYKEITNNDRTIINLASKEYSKCITDYIREDVDFITCSFVEFSKGKLAEKGTFCKMARGEMVRFMAENNIENPEEIKAFDRLGYKFSENHSDKSTYVFIKE
mgnify:CR=1 FL=1